MPTPMRFANLGEVMERFPTLGLYGMCSPNIDSDRRQLGEQSDSVDEIADLLILAVGGVRKPLVGSYWLKHQVERRLDRYVGNGEAIAAALLSGVFPYRELPRCPNVLFGMSRKDVEALSSRT